MLSNGKGVETKIQTQFFVKTPVGGNGVVEYRYWLNDSTSQAQAIKLDKRTNPFKLVTLLPVEKHPIRSSLFQFDVTDGKPTLYAKNDFHMRFYDASGRFVDATEQYVDYQTKQDVTDITPIYNGDHKTVVTPGKNVIRWFEFNAEKGDTVTFRTDQAATLQVFSPEGKEVYSAQGNTSVVYGGCHTWTDGTYYVALHDVTGSKPNTTLEYFHMDKYDVVNQDVDLVGNGGCSTITVDGNGFRDLYAVDFFTAQGDSIHHVDIGHESDAQTSLTFDFSNAALGMYDAVFHFTTEDKVFETLNTIREAEKDANDLIQFVVYHDSVSNIDYGLSQIILSLPPNQTKTFTITIKSTSTVSLEAYMTKEWFPLTDNKVSANGRKRVLRASNRDWMCCQRERFECAADAIASIAGLFMPPGAGCATSLTLTGLETVYDVWCSDGGSASERWDNYLQSQGQSLASRLIQSAVSCVTAYFRFQKKQLMEDRNLAASLGSSTEVERINAELQAVRTMENSAIRGIYNVLTTAILGGDCIKAFTQTKPDCPPNPDGGGGSSTPQPPADPNDIYGYLAESGSKYIADSVAKVSYTIEFENDTAFAKASAHTIVIRDTLDSRYFDLNTFQPMSVKLGEHNLFLNEGDVTTKNDVTSFVKTIDVRPAINAIAQVEGTYTHKTGVAEWRFTSLDPMTMEPSDDLMQGILPVNYDGQSGIGEVVFEIGMKSGKLDGTGIVNRASITFIRYDSCRRHKGY